MSCPGAFRRGQKLTFTYLTTKCQVLSVRPLHVCFTDEQIGGEELNAFS